MANNFLAALGLLTLPFTSVSAETTENDSIISGSSWFVGAKTGVSSFFGMPNNTFSGLRVCGNGKLDVGYWLTPRIGGRMTYQIGKFYNAVGITMNYQFIHADVMYNIVPQKGNFYKRWKIFPFFGIGMAYSPDVTYICPCSVRTSDNHPFALFYGVEAWYAINKNTNIVMEIGNMSTSRLMDGYGSSAKFGDNICSLSAGIVFSLKSKKKKVPSNSLGSYIDGTQQASSKISKHDTVFITKYKTIRDTVFSSNVNISNFIADTSQGKEYIGVPVYVFFKKNMSVFTDSSQKLLIDETAKLAKKYKLKVTVIGSADRPTGSIERNMEISRERANTIRTMLVARDIEPNRITVKYNGGVDLLTPNKANRCACILLSF